MAIKKDRSDLPTSKPKAGGGWQPDEETIFGPLLINAFKEMEGERPDKERHYVSPSNALSCARQLSYRAAGTPGKPMEPSGWWVTSLGKFVHRVLEDALLDRLQDFLLEMGHGFCFEARQKRILIGDEHFFVDLVFYHRILKCHVLVELKTDAFRHEHLGQLNTYVAYYKKHQMTSGDQPPIGILLCTRKNDALVEFALGDLNNQVFVSRYAVELPRKEEMERFITQISQEAGA